jgi:hypothetical protein
MNSTNTKMLNFEKEENSKIPTRTINKYFRLVNKFEKIKTYLKNSKEGFMNTFFNIFAYRFETPLVRPNFYHYTAEAWLLTVFKRLQMDYQEEMMKGIKDFLNYSFNDILEKIYESYTFENDEDLFIENLEVLLGTYKITDHILKITQMKLSQMFLKKIQLAKESTINKRIPEPLSKKNFEDIIFLIIQKALNLTLNELDSREEDKNSLLLLNVFTDMKAKYFEKHDKFESDKNLNKNFSLEEFKQELTKYRKVDESYNTSKADVEIMNPYEIFYYFSISNLGELIQDINIFIINCSGIIGKTQFMIKNNLLKMKSYLEMSKNFAMGLSNNFRLNFFINYVKNIYQILYAKEQQVVQLGKNKFFKLKSWINESAMISTSKDIIFVGFDAMKGMIHDNVYEPIKDVTIMYTKFGLNIFIKYGTYSKEYVMKIYNDLKRKLVELFGEGPLIKFRTDMQEKYLNIAINTSMILTDYEKFRNLIKNSLEQISNKEIIDSLSVNKVKSMLVRNFRKMIGSPYQEVEMSNKKDKRTE